MAQGTAVAESRRVGDAEVVTVGIDVSDRYSHLCSLGDDGEILREERVRTTTAALTRALAPLQDARVVLEVGPRSPWLSRMFSELGHDVIVANPRQVALIARSRRKTDRSDAEHLARLGRFDARSSSFPSGTAEPRRRRTSRCCAAATRWCGRGPRSSTTSGVR